MENKNCRALPDTERKEKFMREYLPEGVAFESSLTKGCFKTVESLEKAAAKGEILEAISTSCDSAHNLIVDLGCMKGIIPRCEGALGIREGTVRDIALISKVGKPVSFTVEGFTNDARGQRTALLSRRRAQELCRDEYISALSPGDIIDAVVTHLEPFGAFCDIGCGCVALVPIDTISVSRISHPKDRLFQGEKIKAVVKSTDGGRITLSIKELLGTWEENASAFTTGETVRGIVRSVESYGIFVELTPNLAGLAESRPYVEVGDTASVFIKSILPEKMKVKLIIIDSFYTESTVSPLKYYINGSRLEEWEYSPHSSEKRIFTRFEPIVK